MLRKTVLLISLMTNVQVFGDNFVAQGGSELINSNITNTLNNDSNSYNQNAMCFKVGYQKTLTDSNQLEAGLKLNSLGTLSLSAGVKSEVFNNISISGSVLTSITRQEAQGEDFGAGVGVRAGLSYQFSHGAYIGLEYSSVSFTTPKESNNYYRLNQNTTGIGIGLEF